MKPKNRKVLEARATVLRARIAATDCPTSVKEECLNELRALEDALSGNSEIMLATAIGQAVYLLTFEMRHCCDYISRTEMNAALDRSLAVLESALGRLGAARPIKGVKRTAFAEATSLDPAWAGRDSSG